MSQISPNFVLQEFVYPEIYQQFGANARWFIDGRIVAVAQYIRTNLNRPVTINNWHTGGQYKESGLRTFNTTTGGKLSQHKFGRAIDVKVSGMAPPKVFEFIKERWAALSALGLTTVENVEFTLQWVHCDLRWTGLSELLIVNP